MAEIMYQFETYISLVVLRAIVLRKFIKDMITPMPNNDIMGQIYSLYSPSPLLMPAIKNKLPNITEVLMSIKE